MDKDIDFVIGRFDKGRYFDCLSTRCKTESKLMCTWENFFFFMSDKDLEARGELK